MTTRTTTQPGAYMPLINLTRVLVMLGAGMILFVLIASAFAIGYGIKYSGRVFPGVTMAGIDFSGMTPEEAARTLSEEIRYPQHGVVGFQDKDKIWAATPADLGLQLDAETSAWAAYSVGRQGNPLARLVNQYRAWQNGVILSPLLLFDERTAYAYLEQVAGQVYLPAYDAALQIEGTQVISQPGQIGRSLDIPATLEPLESQLQDMIDGLLPLQMVSHEPAILDASEQAETARGVLAEPLVLRVPDAGEGDPGPLTIPPEQLAGMLVIQQTNEDPDDIRYTVALDAGSLRPVLEELAPRLARYPQNARFIFNDDTRQLDLIRNAVIGRQLDIKATIADINSRLVAGEHDIPLKIVYTQPAVGDEATGEQLGIRELVSSHTSFFRGSSSSRIHNIQTAASRFHGVLVPPGATFSMAEVMGDVSLDTGYAEALIIFGGRTIEGVGGGVCQVSTTLFRTVFLGGFPIVERHPHAYRVGYYEQTANGRDNNLAGLDATVFVPMVDFKFINDTPNWLLMETYVNPNNQKLTWKFYSTSLGRSVEWNTTGTKNVVDPPKPRYEENPELAKGEIKQVDWAAEGADVTVTRIVYQDGGVLFEDAFHTHYEPWQAVYQYGPGTKIPKDKKN